MPARCKLCLSPKLPILGDGPIPCAVMAIGEGPGKREDQKRNWKTGEGTPFIGDSGMELNNLYLLLCGLTRSQVYVTNCVKCPSPGYRNPSPELADCCSGYWLPDEIRRVQPKVIMTLGAVPLHTLFPGVDLELHHGIPLRAEYAF